MRRKRDQLKDYVNLHVPVVKEYQNAKEKKVNKLS